jgi:hypothetical protein
MSRAKEIIEVLEGFKLGSLGVSKTPVVRGQEDEETPTSVKVLKEGKNKYVDQVKGEERDEPYLCWKDLDGLIYFFELRVDTNMNADSAKFYLYGGKNLRVEEKDGSVAPTDYNWEAEFIASWHYNMLKSQFEKNVSWLKDIGIRHFVVGHDLQYYQAVGYFKSAFQKWLEVKEGAA